MNKIKSWAINFLLKKYALGYLVKGYRAAAGQRTNIAIALGALVWGAQVLGLIPAELADQLYKIIGTIGSITFIEKLKRYQKTAEGLVTVVKEEAAKDAAGVPIVDLVTKLPD
jgi:hypothetical protein